MGKVAGMSYLKEQEHWCRGHGRAGKHWHCGSDTDRRRQNSVYHTQSTMTLWQWHWREEAEHGLSHPVNHDTVAVTLMGGGRTQFITPSQPWHCGSDTDGRRQNSVYHTRSTITLWQWHGQEEAELVYHTQSTMTLWQWHWQEEAELGLSHPVNHDTVAVTLTGGRTRFITPSQPWWLHQGDTRTVMN